MSDSEAICVSSWDDVTVFDHEAFKHILDLARVTKTNRLSLKIGGKHTLSSCYDMAAPEDKNHIARVFSKWDECGFPECKRIPWESINKEIPNNPRIIFQFRTFLNIFWVLNGDVSYTPRERKAKADQFYKEAKEHECNRPWVEVEIGKPKHWARKARDTQSGKGCKSNPSIDEPLKDVELSGALTSNGEKSGEIHSSQDESLKDLEPEGKTDGLSVLSSPPSCSVTTPVKIRRNRYPRSNSWKPPISHQQNTAINEQAYSNIDLNPEQKITHIEASFLHEETIDIDDVDAIESDQEVSCEAIVSEDTQRDALRQEELKKSYESVQRVSTVKPQLPSDLKPRIWAASRQALCETTTFFRSYHGGVYINKDRAYGYLLGGHSSQRDCFCHDGKLIISHGGGKALVSVGQQATDATVRALLNNFHQRVPLVLIADDNYVPFPYDLGEKMYVVLGLYWIVAAWAEKDVDRNKDQKEGALEYYTRIRYKFAFQYYEGQGNPWWLRQKRCIPMHYPDDSDDSDPELESDNMSDTSSDISTESIQGQFVCKYCRIASPLVYKTSEEGICLNRNCHFFFLQGEKEELCLEYRDDFLSLWPTHLAPDLGKKVDIKPRNELVSRDLHTYSKISIRGWWCSGCGQLCPRQKWECWSCPSCKCDFGDNVGFRIREPHEFLAQESIVDKLKFKIYKIHGDSDIKVYTMNHVSFQQISTHFMFILPGFRGKIHLLQGNREFKRRADELFKFYQEEARDKPFLRRYPLRSHHARGQMLSNYFSQNSGAPYKYVSGTDSTVPFDKAPESVVMALEIIKEKSSVILSNRDGPQYEFNEILTAAYMERQRMSWHTDDEKGLGPNVASLSLGSIAVMHFRLRGNRQKELTLVLRHGDVLVMEGAQIQKAYEHTVVPMNFRIAATARSINSTLQK